MSSRPFDLIVIGMGINGAGIACDAALRGLRVLALDKGDIGGETTSWSTRLIHGGLRYLEHLELPLVRESLREREILLRTAPHLIRPLPFLIPVYRGAGRGTWLIRAGMIAYDLLSYDKSLPRHRMLGRAETLRRAPGLNPQGLKSAALYFDAQVAYPERLTLENVLMALEYDAVALTHAQVDRLVQHGNTIAGVEFTDLLAGSLHTAQAPVTINATGPWVDTLLAQIEPPVRRQIGGTKGSHIVVAAFPGAPGDALYVEALADRRPYFIVPWNGMYLIGTTDERYRGGMDAVAADATEIAYLIGETNRVIPSARLKPDDVLYSYAGVRPLPYQPEGVEGGITRRHLIHDHAPAVGGLISIVGGKLTTYRNLAALAVDMVYRKLGTRRPRPATDRLPLPGGRADDFPRFASQFIAESELGEEAAGRLIRIYGTRAPEVLGRAGGDPALRTSFASGGAIGAEIPFAFEQELAQTLTDVLMRRTMIGLDPAAAEGTGRAAELAGKYLGWDRGRIERELAAYYGYRARFMLGIAQSQGRV